MTFGRPLLFAACRPAPAAPDECEREQHDTAAPPGSHFNNWNAASAASIVAAPSPCSGVMVSPRTSALPTIAISGSRFMISAVRNGPTRMVETKMKTMAAVVARLMPRSAAQPALLCGGCPLWVDDRITGPQPPVGADPEDAGDDHHA